MSAMQHHVWTEKEYLAYERAHDTKHEFYQGIVYAMAGASPNHVLIATNTSTSLNVQLRGEPCRVYQTDLRIRVSASGLYTYPDVTVVCGSLEFAPDDAETLLNPSVIVEVLSPSTEAYDRGKKFEFYRTLKSLRECILISQDAAHVECYSRNDDGQWVLSEASGMEAVLNLKSLPCILPLNEVYEKVAFSDSLP